MLKTLSTNAIELPLITGLIAAFILLLGLACLALLPLQATPPARIPIIIVSVPYPGASPAEVQSEIIRELEDKLKELKNVRHITSKAAEGIGVSVVEFYDNVDVDQAKREVRDKAEMARAEFPNEAEIFAIQDINFDDIPVLYITLSDSRPQERRETVLMELNAIAREVEDNILGIDGVSSVDKYGSLETEVRVQFAPKKMKAYGISSAQLTQAIQNQNIAFPGGSIDFKDSKLTVRVVGKAQRAKELDNIVVWSRGGKQVLLKDLAQIYISTKRPVSYSRMQGRPALTLLLHHKVGTNIIHLISKIKERIRQLRSTVIPAYITVTYSKDQSYWIWMMISQLGQSALFGGILVVAILYFSMGLRNALLIAAAIPFSVLFCFICQLAFDISINNMTLFSLILILGMVVDGAIVVGENIYRHFEMGKPPRQAALDGIHEVGMAVIAADLTTIAAFLPMLFMTGLMAHWMEIMPKVVAFTLVGSMIIDHFVLPVLANFFMRRSKEIPADLSKAKGHHSMIVRIAARFFGFWARHRLLSLLLTVVPGWPLGLYLLNVGAPIFDMWASGHEKVSANVTSQMLAILVGTIICDIIFRYFLIRFFGQTTPVSDSDELAGIASKQGRIYRFYDQLLAFALNHPSVVVMLCGLALLNAVLLPISGYIGSEFFGENDNGMCFIHYELPPGASIEDNYRFAPLIERILPETLHCYRCSNPSCNFPAGLIPPSSHCPICHSLIESELKAVITTIGEPTSWFYGDGSSSGPEFGSLEIELMPLTERLEIPMRVPRRQTWSQIPFIYFLQEWYCGGGDEIIKVKRARTVYEILELQKQWVRGRFPGVKFRFEAQQDGPPVGPPIQVQVTGKRLETLVEIAKSIEEILQATSECTNIINSHYSGRAEIKIKPRLDIAAMYGLTPREISMAIFTAFNGLEASKMTVDDREVDIRLENAETSRKFFEDVEEMELTCSQGKTVPLKAVAKITLEPSVAMLTRYDLMQNITLSAEIINSADTESIKALVHERVMSLGLPPGVILKWGGSEEEHQESMRSLRYAFNIALILILFIMIGQFNSIRQPFVVMTTIPLSIVGAVMGLYITGNKLSFLAMVGIVCLSGIVVNDAIVFVDFLNQTRRRGVPIFDAIVLTGRARLRAILMTTITTVVGLLPLTLNLSGGGAFWEDMGYSIIFGLLVASLLTLVVIPTLYSLVERDRWQPWLLGKLSRWCYLRYHKLRLRQALRSENQNQLNEWCALASDSLPNLQEQARRLLQAKDQQFRDDFFANAIVFSEKIALPQLYQLATRCRQLAGCTWTLDDRLGSGLRDILKELVSEWRRYKGKPAPLGSFFSERERSSS